MKINTFLETSGRATFIWGAIIMTNVGMQPKCNAWISLLLAILAVSSLFMAVIDLHEKEKQ